MLFFLALLAVSLLPQAGEPLRDSVEVLQIEQVYGLFDDKPTLNLVQAIFWSGDVDGHPVVRDWRIIKDGFTLHHDRLEWVEGEAVRSVRFKLLRRNFSLEDSELENRTVLPTERRYRLTPEVRR